MSSRARRITNPGAVVAFPWKKMAAGSAHDEESEAPSRSAAFQVQLEAVDREAHARGYDEGEKAGARAAAQQTELLLRRLTQSLQDVARARTEMIQRTERQMVELALTLARRVVQKEIDADPTQLLAMTRGAIDRLGEDTRITVRLNPVDYAAAGGENMPQLGTTVTVVADPKVEHGGCRIESELGTLDAGIDVQLQELGRGLLGDDQESALSNVA